MDDFTNEQYQHAKFADLLQVICDYCNNKHLKTKRGIYINKRDGDKNYCSKQCAHKGRTTKVEVLCKNCNINFLKAKNQLLKYPNNFCSSSCSAIYNNTHKTTGTRISKLELWLQSKLPMLYPDLEFKFNSKAEINSELDIYIPNLRLAFELNGIFHYEPIYGLDKLSKTQNNDLRKFQACLEHNIEFCIIDTSKQRRFTELSSKIYLEIIQQIINLKVPAQCIAHHGAAALGSTDPPPSLGVYTGNIL